MHGVFQALVSLVKGLLMLFYLIGMGPARVKAAFQRWTAWGRKSHAATRETARKAQVSAIHTTTKQGL